MSIYTWTPAPKVEIGDIIAGFGKVETISTSAWSGCYTFGNNAGAITRIPERSNVQTRSTKVMAA